jgi:hypothetical protein
MSGGVKEPVELDLDAQIAELTAVISPNPRDAKAVPIGNQIRTYS